MSTFLLGGFIILHGLVHLLYFALSRKLFNLNTPLVGWPERSWLFSSFFRDSTTCAIANVLYALATVLFVVSGIGILIQATWWGLLLVSAVLISSATIIIFWDGKLQRLPDKGFIGVLINVVILGAGLLLNNA